MSRRIDRVNSVIKETFGKILQEEADRPNDVMITVSRVETARNLQSATVWLYIYPIERAQDVLADIKEQMYALQGSFNRNVSFKPIPRIKLAIDEGMEHADTINKKLDELRGEDE